MKKVIFAVFIIIILIFLLNGFSLSFINNLFNTENNTDQNSRAIAIMQKKEVLSAEELKFLLADTYIPLLKIGPKDYLIDHGKVINQDKIEISGDEERKLLQLALFYLKTKEDPLFTSPDFDLPEFIKSIDILEQEQTQFLEPQKRDISIFPLSFLKTLSEVADTQKLFFSDPNPKTAQKLLETYQKTSAAYQEEIEKLTTLLEANKELFDSNDIIQLKVVTNRDIFLSDLNKIIQNAKIISEEIQKRQNCLEKGQNCNRQLFLFDKPDIKTLTEEKFNLLPLDILFPIFTPSSNQIRGPYIIHSPCWGWGKDFSNPSRSVYIKDSKSPYISNSQGQNPSTQIFKLATDQFFRKPSGNNPMDEGLRKLGLPWVVQSETAGYMCRNLEYQPKLTTLDYFWQKYRSQPLLDKSTIKAAEKFRKFESDFFNSKSPSDQDLETLANIYAYTYRLLISQESEHEIADKLLSRYLSINRQLSNFHLNLNRYATEFTILIRMQKEKPGLFADNHIFYAYVFPFKSYWNVLYFPFSPSFWKSDQKLEYLKKFNIDDRPLERKWIISYQEALTFASPDEIKKWAVVGSEYIRKNLPEIQVQ